MFRTNIGDVQETFRTEMEVGFEWRIHNIFSMVKDRSLSFSSPYVSFLGTEWCLKMYLNGFHHYNKEWISVESVKLVPVQYTVGIKETDGIEQEIVLNKTLPECQKAQNFTKSLRISDLWRHKSQLVPSDILTFTCRIRSYIPPHVRDDSSSSSRSEANTENLRTATSARKDKSVHRDPPAKTTVSCGTQTETVSDAALRAEEGSRAEGGSRAEELNDLDIKGVFTLRKHLKDLLLNEDYHDVTFKVKDREFRTHRNVLTARSPVFAAMFKHDMKESTDVPIDIVDCSPEAFAEFLQYVYTGKVENFSPSTALGLYYAGDKYDVSGLKEVCVEFLKTSLSATAICDVITLAAKHGEEELYELAMAFFSERLDEVMSTKEWQRFLAENLVQANEMCLKAVKSMKSKKN